jgi:ATP-dependent DNA helicase RecQ
MMDKIHQLLLKHWGYNDFLPLQEEAMGCLCAKRDSVVVLPTGGGKSLCYQAPALAMDGMAVVVSPLIALMKDQVDALTECGVSAMRLDSSQSSDEQDRVLGRVQEGTLKLLYLSPERLLSNGFTELLEKTSLSYIAVDEAHCVSMWGHDFRPEYRQLGRLKKVFPGITIAAYTATATEHVRRDIAEQLKLNQPKMLVGSFDRPNLIYKVKPRRETVSQVCEVLDRYKGESGIIYCIRRKDVDTLSAQLEKKGYRVAPYHAGMTDQGRKENQDRFINDHVDIIVATIAFGMGIDKSNVRFVIHTGMPKSLEHYQQESGRAGREGLDAECTLFYSGADYGTWKSLMRDMSEESQKIAMMKLDHMYRFCTSSLCRHKAILNYFNQPLDKENCTACDVCMGELDYVEGALVIAQKILSCVLRLGQRFGGAYTSAVLVGSEDKRILESGHDRLSTYGLLSDTPRTVVQDWIEQLVGQGYLDKTGEYNVLTATEKGRLLLKGCVTPRLVKPSQKPVKVSKVASDSWEGVDRNLFEKLRELRTEIASAKHMPAYIVFGDAVLRDMARRRPLTPDEFLQVKGVGQQKCNRYGKAFLAVMQAYCGKIVQREKITEAQTETVRPRKKNKASGPSHSRDRVFELFGRKCSISEAAVQSGQAESTIVQYLADYIHAERLSSPLPWVDHQTFESVRQAAEQAHDGQLKTIYEILEGRIDYAQIRICVACLRYME